MTGLEQIGAEAVKTGSFVSGNFLIDGAILIAMLKVVEAGLRWMARFVRPANGKNGGPRPGETETCRDHGEQIAALVEFKTAASASLVRIESKVDTLLGRGK